MRILTHGGAGSDPQLSETTQQAARIAQEALDAGQSAMDAACHATAHMEDEAGFNAGTGSNVREDGRTVEMDAACMDQTGAFGAVACIERVRHPVFVARHVAETEQILLAGHGARRFARSKGIPDWDPHTEQASSKGEGGADTVGCVLHDGSLFAAALSSGGTKQAPRGRVGDVPLPGCGLHAGPAGAVAVTGHGETLALGLTAVRAYEELEDGQHPQDMVEAVVEAFPSERSVGLIAVTEAHGAVASNRTMAASHLAPEEDPNA